MSQERPSWDALIREYSECPCGHSTFSVATRMATYYPNETRALLPQVNFSQVGLDGRTGDNGSVWEVAAYLTAAKIAVLPKDRNGLPAEAVLQNTARLAQVDMNDIENNASLRFNRERDHAARGVNPGCERLPY